MILTSLMVGLRVAIGLVFLVSGVMKMRAPRSFTAGVAAYRVVPDRLVGVTAGALIVAEIGAAAALLSGSASLAGGLVALGLGVLFATAVGVNLHRRARIPCHCFGTGEPISLRTLARAIALAVGAALIVIADLAGLDISFAGWSATTVIQLSVGVGYVLLAAWAFVILEAESRLS